MRTIGVLAALLLAAALTVLAETPPQAEFPHEFHFDDLEIDCVTCHHETDAAALSIPHQEDFEHFSDSWPSCKRCHRDTPEPTSPQACANCHHDSPTDIADETLSSKVVIHRSCWSCHEVGAGQSASQACGQCHRSDPGGAP
jgi:formate-dependent nitrite reductase cytochrome c552 subunit